MAHALDDVMFERARLAALRTFRVILASGPREGEAVLVRAHLHDGGDSRAGHLQFTTISANGHQKISRVFNAGHWREVEEVTENAEEVDSARDRLLDALTRKQGAVMPDTELHKLPTPKGKM